jgi:hypothetical protein
VTLPRKEDEAMPRHADRPRLSRRSLLTRASRMLGVAGVGVPTINQILAQKPPTGA